MITTDQLHFIRLASRRSLFVFTHVLKESSNSAFMPARLSSLDMNIASFMWCTHVKHQAFVEWDEV
jgi:hypothetical protein